MEACERKEGSEAEIEPYRTVSLRRSQDPRRDGIRIVLPFEKCPPELLMSSSQNTHVWILLLAFQI